MKWDYQAHVRLMVGVLSVYTDPTEVYEESYLWIYVYRFMSDSSVNAHFDVMPKTPFVNSKVHYLNT